MELFVLLFTENMMCQDFFWGQFDNWGWGEISTLDIFIGITSMFCWGTRLITCQDSNRGVIYKNRI